MSGETCPKPTWKQKFQCLGWGLLAVVATPPLLLLSIPSVLAVWLKERRDGFTQPSPEEVARLHQRLASKKKGDVITIDGIAHTVAWTHVEIGDPTAHTEIHLADDFVIHTSAKKFELMRYHPRWWFIKSSLRLHFKDIN